MLRTVKALERIAERNYEREDDEARAHHAILGAGERDGEEGPRARRAERGGRLVEPRVGHRQRGHEDHQGVREAVEDLGDDDAGRAVDRAAEKQELQRLVSGRTTG